MSTFKLSALAIVLAVASAPTMAQGDVPRELAIILDCTVIIDAPAAGGRKTQTADASVQVLETKDRITISGMSKHPSARFNLTSYGPTPTVQRFNRSDDTTWAVETRDVGGAALTRVGVNKSTYALGLQTITAVPGKSVYVTGVCKQAGKIGA